MDHNSERDERIASLLPLLKKIARRLHRMLPHIDLDDLVGEGCVGAIRAVDTFDPDRGPSLEQFAGCIIAGVMLNGVRRWDPVSERVRREIREAERQRNDIALATGRMLNDVELEQQRPTLRRARTAAWQGQPVSLDIALPIGLEMPVDWSCDPARVWETQDLHHTLRQHVNALPQRYRDLVVAHYYGERSLRSIALNGPVSPQRLSQLHCKAIATLRKRIDASAH